MLKLIGVAAALVATAAVAQAPNEGTTRNAPGNDDPNEVICVYQNTTGSRVNRTRVCRTRQQWSESRQETRKSVERVQSFKTTSGN
jgi:hypothetical protein